MPSLIKAGTSVFGGIRQLGQYASAQTSRIQQSLYGGTTPQQIRGISSDAWPNPLQPVYPSAPDGSRPLVWNYNPGQNLNFTPRPDAEYSAKQLRSLATYPLARICIENIKDIVTQARWVVQPRLKHGESQKDHMKRAQGDEYITRIARFFERPNGHDDWATWVRPLLDAMLVTDSGTILLNRSGKKKTGPIDRLDVVLGSDSITRYIDEGGYTPEPPSPAYAQCYFGTPRVALTTDQLLYAPRNIVPRNTISSMLYGMSQTEINATEIEIGIQRLQFVLSYYTSGSIPDVLQIAPDGVRAPQIAEAMQANNSMMAGNFEARRGWTILQGFAKDGKPDQIIFPKEKLLADTYDDLHIRKIAFGYGNSPQRLLKQMNRSSSESSQDAAEEEGSRPSVIWLQSVMNVILQLKMGLTEYEFVFQTNRESDIIKQMQADTGYIKEGVYSRNERRALRGDDPRPEPEADELAITTPQGYVPLGVILATQNTGNDTNHSDTRNKPDSKDSKQKPDAGKTIKPNGLDHGHRLVERASMEAL